MFGVRFTLDGLYIKPCLPKEYKNSEIALKYFDKTLRIKFNGYGNKIVSASVNGKKDDTKDRILMINKNEIQGDMLIVLEL